MATRLEAPEVEPRDVEGDVQITGVTRRFGDVVALRDVTLSAAPGEVVAVRVAVVARSPQLEKTAVSPATLPLWNGGTLANGGAISLTGTAQQYRYKVYQTTIPLRNVIWNNN